MVGGALTHGTLLQFLEYVRIIRRVESFAIFWQVYHVTEVVQGVVGCILVFGLLTCCALLYSMRDLKVAQIAAQWSLIWEFMPYNFEPGHNIKEVTKNIYCAKGKDAFDHSPITWLFMRFRTSCKNLGD